MLSTLKFTGDGVSGRSIIEFTSVGAFCEGYIVFTLLGASDDASQCSGPVG